jgi:hypothetical protein
MKSVKRREAYMEIKNISQKIFRTSPSKTENNHSNPFGVNFKGNIINADVFDSSEKKSNISFKGAEIATKVANKGKLWTSAMVGSINNASEAMSKLLNPVKDFGRTIKENALKIKENAIKMKDKAINLCKDFNDTNYYPVNLDKQDPADLGLMLENLIAVRG